MGPKSSQAEVENKIHGNTSVQPKEQNLQNPNYMAAAWIDIQIFTLIKRENRMAAGSHVYMHEKKLFINNLKLTSKKGENLLRKR